MSLLFSTRVSGDDRVWGHDSIPMTRDQVETRDIRGKIFYQLTSELGMMASAMAIGRY